MLEKGRSFTVLVLFSLMLASALGQTTAASNNTTTAAPSTTPAVATVSGTILLVKINGVFVNLTNCSVDLLGGLNCTSDLQHDVTVVRVETTGTEGWVIAMIVVNSVLLLVVGGVAVAGYFNRRAQQQQWQPVPGSDPNAQPPGQMMPQGPFYYPQPADPGYGNGPPGYGPVYNAAHMGAKKVIGVALVRPTLPDVA